MWEPSTSLLFIQSEHETFTSQTLLATGKFIEAAKASLMMYEYCLENIVVKSKEP